MRYLSLFIILIMAALLISSCAYQQPAYMKKGYGCKIYRKGSYTIGVQ